MRENCTSGSVERASSNGRSYSVRPKKKKHTRLARSNLLMSDRRIDAFFYGLFMDPRVLKKSDIQSVNPRQAYAEGYGLVIGNRATLVSAPGQRSYGMLLSVTHVELNKLYSAAGLEEYRPEAITVNLMGVRTLPAMCYNLLSPPKPDEANPEYATMLREVLFRLEFPTEYIESIV